MHPLIFLLASLSSIASPPPHDASLHALLAETVRASPEERSDLQAHLHDQARSLAVDLGEPSAVQAWSAALRAEVRDRLETRHAAGLLTTPEQARRLIIDFETYKVRGYVGSGVYPRRYFGYLDATGNTAAEELRVVRTVRACTDVANAWLAEQGLEWRVTDQEIVVTWISEGGALLLRDPARARQPIHPILGVGLDDIAHGFQELPGLVGRMDAAAGTRVETIPEWMDGDWRLTRSMSLEESVVGTTIMWVWEKRIADRKLRQAGRAPMHRHDRTDQFILTSLVYNSGLIHASGRPAQVRAWSLAPHLSGLASKHNPTGRRAHLPVTPSRTALERLRSGRGYPYQGTSWIALYHIQQRYGGYEALERFTDTFDADGRLVMEPWEALEARLAEEAAAAQEEELSAQAQASSARSTCAGCRNSAPASWLGVVFLGLARRRRALSSARGTG